MLLHILHIQPPGFRVLEDELLQPAELLGSQSSFNRRLAEGLQFLEFLPGRVHVRPSASRDRVTHSCSVRRMRLKARYTASSERLSCREMTSIASASL